MGKASTARTAFRSASSQLPYHRRGGDIQQAETFPFAVSDLARETNPPFEFVENTRKIQIGAQRGQIAPRSQFLSRDVVSASHFDRRGHVGKRVIEAAQTGQSKCFDLQGAADDVR